MPGLTSVAKTSAALDGYQDGLRAGLDFRRPEYRRSVFLRFYEFHLRYRAHPGCVYFLMPWLKSHFGWDDEQALWFAFLNGNTQHPPTSWLLFQQAPAPRYAEGILEWFARHSARLEFDTDRRHHRRVFPESVRAYVDWLDGRRQLKAIGEIALAGWPAMWSWASSLYSFGRLSAFSYLEYLRIMGVDFDCEDLMFGDREGSKSHRNGLCIVLGRDDLDWHPSTNPRFEGHYPKYLLDWLGLQAGRLLDDMRARSQGQPWARDVSYFTLESALCTYKSWHRPNRRYPNVYSDMLYNRLRKAEKTWGHAFDHFWQARRDCLPPALRLEDNPLDPGLAPAKQNHYLNTGQCIVMDLDWACFENDFAKAVASGKFGRRAIR